MRNNMVRRNGWVVWLVALVLVAGCSGAGAADAAQSDARLPQVVTEGRPARDFSMLTLDGDVVTLSELRGRWVLLNFWATWCPPCVEEMPYLSHVARERAIEVLGVNYDETRDRAARFVDENNIPFPVLVQPDDATLLFYDTSGIPRTYVIDPEGNVAVQVIGAIRPDAFEAMLDEQGIPRRE
jgi:thiol-disulfide isomerase/thioredoxin